MLNTEADVSVVKLTNDSLKKENRSLAELVKQYAVKTSELSMRIRDYGVEAPCLKSDLILVCPSFHKSIEHNRFLLMIIDTVMGLHAQLSRKKRPVPKCVQTVYFSGVN